MTTLNPIKIISLFAELTSGLKVSEFLAKYCQEGVDKINIKYFIEFGLLNKLIYRMHRYIINNVSTQRKQRNKSPQRDRFFFVEQPKLLPD